MPVPTRHPRIDGRLAFAILLIAGCGSTPSADPAGADPPVALTPTPASPPPAVSPKPATDPAPPNSPIPPTELSGPTYRLESHAVQLRQSNETCSVWVTVDGKDASLDLALELTPPCYWMRWPGSPQTRPAQSGGIPQGEKDGPMAWTYPDADSATALIVTGGPITETDPERRSKLEANHCGQKIQGIVLVADGARSTERKSGGSAICERAGIDEREYWLFAHEG